MIKQTFIHLRVHTEYSLVDGTVCINPLMNALHDMDMAACAVTDQSNMFAAIKFYQTALSNKIKPIIGAECRLKSGDHLSEIILLCTNQQGYLCLCELISRCYIEGQDEGLPTLDKAWLFANNKGLIVLSGGRNGDIGQALSNNNMALARSLTEQWKQHFAERFYFELQRTARSGEEKYIHAVVDLAIEMDMPVVATNDVRFLQKEDFQAHEARVCINEGRVLDDSRRVTPFSENQYLVSASEMQALFRDIPEALANTVEIAKRCHLNIQLGENFLPDFPVPEGQTLESFFISESEKGLAVRLEKLFAPEKREAVREQYENRLKHELDVIITMGFPGYFLIVADFIRWAKENDVPVGPGRGSGAGSLVAYSLLITDLDPLAYDLLFERFLNPERVSLPDFDIDFCMEGRDRVIDYVSRHYGRERVSQIITYGCMKAKAVIRDVGRVLGHPYGFIDKIAKLIPFDLSMTLDKALDEVAELRQRYHEEEEVGYLIDLAKKLEGIARHAGKHAGGVVIAPSKLTDFSPLYSEPGGVGIATQYDKNDVESAGLVKFDFLGLRTLTIIDWAVKAINQKGQQTDNGLLDISQIPIDDQATFDLLKRSQTTAVFQLESRGMKELINRLQPDSFEDIIALVALFRPGPLQSGMVDDFIERKHGRSEVVYAHPDLEPILRPTYGVILYQEQVMQIAQVLAKYTLGGADMLRRAMGKKKAEEMAKQRNVFIDGAEKNNVEKETAAYIFDLMEKFAGYGFNKSHSAAYALLSYQTAWLKTHHSEAFMAAVMSADMDNTDKIVILVDECKQMKLTLLPPNVNCSDYAFKVDHDKRILYGLGAIKGVGEAALESIVKERKQRGKYTNMLNFCRQVAMKKVSKRVMETLINAGAMDELAENRATMMSYYAKIMVLAEQLNADEAKGQVDLFSTVAQQNEIPAQFKSLDEWPDKQLLTLEKQALGLYLSGHPINRYKEDIQHLSGGSIQSLTSKVPTGGGYNKAKMVTLIGLLVSIRINQTARGKMAILTLDDQTAVIEITLFQEAMEDYAAYLKIDEILVIKGTLRYDEYRDAIKINATEVMPIQTARSEKAKRLWINLTEMSKKDVTQQLKNIFAPHRPGQCLVLAAYRNETAIVKLQFGEQWRILPNDELLDDLKALLGEAQVKIEY